MDRDVAYAILEISAQATPEEVRAAYRRRAFATHPDRAGGDAAAFHAVAAAYRVLASPAGEGAQEPAPGSEPDGSPQVPPTDAAKILFEYLSDLASEMILNGATPDSVVSFLAREGCPESVARALERDLRERVQPAANEPAAGAGPVEPPVSAPPAEPPAARRSVRSVTRWLTATVVAAAVAAFVFGVWSLARRPSAPAESVEAAPLAPSAVAPRPADPPSTSDTPNTPSVARPPRTAPARAVAKQAPRPPADHAVASLRGTSAELDAERDALEADQRRFATEAAELAAESARIDAENAALSSTADIGQQTALAVRKADYNARVQRARRTEKTLERRVRELNAKIVAYNERLRAQR